MIFFCVCACMIHRTKYVVIHKLVPQEIEDEHPLQLLDYAVFNFTQLLSIFSYRPQGLTIY